MYEYLLITIVVLIIATAMTSVGKGGGNFYLLVLVIAGIPIYEASTTGQFMLLTASYTGIIVFGKSKAVNWQLAIPVGVLVAIAAFTGGFLSILFDEILLKMIFAILLTLTGVLMVIPFSPREYNPTEKHRGHMIIQSNNKDVVINMRIVVPVTLLTGFFSGMIGVSGGSFLVPMLVLACNLPMKTSVTTVTPLIAVSATMGFLGHASQGHFNPYLAIPLALVALIGGFLGGKFALKSKPKNLKKLFAVSNWAAALIMTINLLLTVGIIAI